MQGKASAKALRARRSGALRGHAKIPGDKSISHRALILGGLAVGETRVEGLLEADDVLRTAAAMRVLGAEVVADGAGAWRIYGRGVGGLSEPQDVIDFGNSGTGSRLVMGAIATTPMTAVFTGDASLRRRPMGRVLRPLAAFGAEYFARDDEYMPLAVRGSERPLAIEYEVTIPSAQVKSALLLAALNAPGRTRITQRECTRDHTEKMLRAFGAHVLVETLAEGEAIELEGECELRPASIVVPADPSSAAFAIVAATIVPGSDVTIPSVLLNPRRAGFIDVLKEMGANIIVENLRESGGETIGDLKVRHALLQSVDVAPERAPSMIDEYPVLAIAAAFADGRSKMSGLEELIVKETDRLAATVKVLLACGVRAQAEGGQMVIEGRGTLGVPGGARIAAEMDHRIAMSFLTLGLASRDPVSIDDTSMIGTSFPSFESLMRDLGADLSVPNA